MLIDTFLSLIPMAFKLLYEQEWIMNPKAVFWQCFDWSIIKYGFTLAQDCKTDQTAISANWHPSMGFELLTLHLFCSVTFTSLSGHLIKDKNTIDISVHVINCTGLSQRNTRPGFSVVMLPANQTPLSPSKHSGRMQSKLRHLLLSL
jgi:hypothetical protein